MYRQADCVVKKPAFGGNDDCFTSASVPASPCNWNGAWDAGSGAPRLNLVQNGNQVIGGSKSSGLTLKGVASGNSVNGTWTQAGQTIPSGAFRATWTVLAGFNDVGPGQSPDCGSFNYYFGPTADNEYLTIAAYERWSACDPSDIPSSLSSAGCGTSSGSAVPIATLSRPDLGALDAIISPGNRLSGTTGTLAQSNWTVPFQTSRGLIQLSPSGDSLTGSDDGGQGQIIASAVDNVLKGAWFHAPTFSPPNDAGDLNFVLSDDGSSFSGRWASAADESFPTDWTGTAAPQTSGQTGAPPAPGGPWPGAPATSSTGGAISASGSPAATATPSGSGSGGGASNAGSGNTGGSVVSGGSASASSSASGTSGGAQSCPGNYVYTSSGGCLVPQASPTPVSGAGSSGSTSTAATAGSGTAGTPDAEIDLWYSDQRGDNFTTATAQGRADAQAAGYRFVRIEGRAFSTQRAGTVPLNLYYSDWRRDNFTLATAQGASDAQAAGYRFVRIEGYVFPAQAGR